MSTSSKILTEWMDAWDYIEKDYGTPSQTAALELERATCRTCTDLYLASSLALLGSIGLELFG